MSNKNKEVPAPLSPKEVDELKAVQSKVFRLKVNEIELPVDFTTEQAAHDTKHSLQITRPNDVYEVIPA